MKLGDAVHKVAQPIAKRLDRVLGTDIEHCTGCAHRRDVLNVWSDNFWDWWKQKGDNTMNDWIVTWQYAVQADDPAAAIAASKNMPCISVQAMLRMPPQPAPQPQQQPAKK